MSGSLDARGIDAWRGQRFVAVCLALSLMSAGCVDYVLLARLPSTADRPWTLAHIVKPRRNEPRGSFGAALALTNRHLLVGAPASSDCGGPIDADLDCPGGTLNAWWRPLMRGAPPVVLKPSRGEARLFGAVISAVAGEIWVGGPGTSLRGDIMGTVVEYARRGVGWSDPAEIQVAGLPANSGLGMQVALAPPWAAVLAPHAPCSDPPGAVGLVHVMSQSVELGWAPFGTVCVDRGTAGDFGNRGQWGGMAITSDRLVLGAPWTKDSTVGTVKVYRLKPKTDTEPEGIVLEQELRPDVAVAVQPDGFGVAVAVDGERIYVGAPGEEAAYTFKSTKSGWRQEQRLWVDGGAAGRFGSAVAVSHSQLLIGAPDDENCEIGIDPEGWSNDCRGTGAAFLYVLDRDGVWIERHYIKPPIVGSSNFGTAVAISGSTFAVGAPTETTEGTGIDGELGLQSAARGAVFVYERNDDEAR